MADEISINCGAMRIAAIPYEDQPWTQARADALWQAIGYPPPAPRVPASLVGHRTIATRAGQRVAELGSKKALRKTPKAGAPSKEERDFLNFWGKAVVDPCRQQSTISKIAGGALQLVSLVAPAAATMFAVADTGNALLDVSRMGRDMANAEKQLTTAALATAPATSIVPQALAPVPAVAPVSTLVSQPVAMPVKVVRSKPAWQPRDYALAAGASIFIYLLIRRLRR